MQLLDFRSYYFLKYSIASSPPLMIFTSVDLNFGKLKIVSTKFRDLTSVLWCYSVILFFLPFRNEHAEERSIILKGNLLLKHYFV
jgi:hypothetical protein